MQLEHRWDRPQVPPLPRRAGRLATTLAVLAALTGPVAATERADSSSDGVAFFETKIRPVLAKHCYSCHSGSVQARGGLRLDTRVGVLIGGQSGPAVVPGHPDKSKIISVLSYEGPEMPPAGKLADETIADFKKWIALGAPDPRGEEKTLKPKKIDIEAERKNWVYQAPHKPPVPEAKGKGWAWSPVDHFVRAKQEAVGTKPVKDADPIVWLRRVSMDLTGLPPTPEQITAVERDSSRAAREKIVDQLLASPQYGERWGRHWLDVARYAESTGKERNFVYAQAWRYRDWVIDAFNRDKPYNQFIREQVAGDLLPAENSAQRDANLIATGFLALGPKGINERNRESYLLDIVDEQIENVGRAVLGMSVSCARCHHHKFDPITTNDYYSLAGIFRSSEAKVGIANRQQTIGQPDLLARLATGHLPADAQLLADIKKYEKQARAKIDDLRRVRESATAEVLAAVAAATPVNQANGFGTVSDPNEPEPVPPAGPTPAPGSIEDIKRRQDSLIWTARRLNGLKQKLGVSSADGTAIAMADLPEPKDINVRIRGEADNAGPVAPRGFLSVIAVKDPPAVPKTESGRRELADWLTRPDHPLTARVVTNRLWAKLFGVGIVPTPDEFGDQGQKPTNPEVLDYLAVRFVENGWSIKKTLKELVLTRTYQLSGADDTADLAKDEANVSLWRWNRKRLDAEVLRDATLAASGRLDLTRPHGSPVIKLGLVELGPLSDFSPVQQPTDHRSVYLPVLRNKPPEQLAVFDLPDPSLVVGQRETTTSPSQALYVLNSPFILEQSEHLARRLLAEQELSDDARIDKAYQAVLSRHPTPAERERVVRFLSSASVQKGDARLSAWSRFAQALFALPEFRYEL